MKSDGNSGYIHENLRWSRYFVGTSVLEEETAVCNSVKMDLGEIDPETRFFEALTREWGMGRYDDEDAVPGFKHRGKVFNYVTKAVHAMMADDISHVTHRIAWALDGIEPHLYDNHMLVCSTPRWRKELGSWRNLLANLSKELGDGPARRSPELAEVRDKVDRTSRRVDAAFEALVGSNTLESLERARKSKA